jgi:hypothetical protein
MAVYVVKDTVKHCVCLVLSDLFTSIKISNQN